jgi:hypothetical protein
MTGIWWTKTTEHGELLVFRNGQLVHKRWPGGVSALFATVPTFTYWHRLGASWA